MRTPAPDLQFCNHGSVVTCTPVSLRGEIWAAERLLDSGECLRTPDSIPIDPRYLEDIVLGARAEGLVCHG